MDLSPHGPLGILWVGLGLGAFYVALVWINSLLGIFLTPLFIVPLTWLQDAVTERRRGRRVDAARVDGRPVDGRPVVVDTRVQDPRAR